MDSGKPVVKNLDTSILHLLVIGVFLILCGFFLIYGPVIASWVWLLICGCVLAVLSILFLRSDRQIDKTIRQALLPFVGPGSQVRCYRWRRVKRFKVPQKVVIRYGPHAKDWEPKWAQQIVAMVSVRTEIEYEIVDSSSRERFLVLEIKKDRSDVVVTEKMMVEDRARVTMGELLGKDVKVYPQWSGDILSSLSVRFSEEMAVKLTSQMRRQHAERVVTAMMPGRWRARWDVESLHVVFEVRPPMPEYVAHPFVAVSDENRFLIPTGLSEDGDVIVWDLKSTVPHGLTVGKTGTGKTVQILGIVMEWALRGWAVWISDPKQIEFIGLKRWPNVQLVAVTVEEQMAMVVKAWNLMEERYSAIVSGADERDFEPVLVLLDEYTDFVSAVSHWWAENRPKGAPSKSPIFGMLGSLARKARSAKVHLLFGLQRPDAAFLGGEMRDNLGFRTSLGRLSPEGARMMWGAPYIGSSVPNRIPGRGMAMDSEGVSVEAQSYWTPDPRRALRDDKQEDLDILRRLLPERVDHKRLDFVFAGEGDPAWFDDSGKSTFDPWQAILECETRVARDADDLIDLYGEFESSDSDGEPGSKRRHLRIVDSVPEPDVQDDYGPEKRIAADSLRAGDLLLLDEDWVVVESASIDFEDESMVALSWRSDGDEFGDLAVETGDYVVVRSPVEKVIGEV